jgi:hypothetical protein
MVFAANTPAAAAFQKLNKGDRMHVMGIPCISLERISFAMKTSHGSPVTVALPYEMIIIGSFSDFVLGELASGTNCFVTLLT